MISYPLIINRKIRGDKEWDEFCEKFRLEYLRECSMNEEHKKYNELYDELENLALELGNHMMDCKEGSYEDLSALAHKIIKDLSKLI